MSDAPADAFLLPALDKTEAEGYGVHWKRVMKLVRFINTSKCITPDVHYSLKTRLKCSDQHRVINTLTVFSRF